MASKGIKATYRNGYAEGGLLADSSRTWKMESDYPEYQKGIANRLSKENVPAQEIEEQFMYSPLQTGYAEGGEVDNFMDADASLLQPEVPLDFENEMPMGDVMGDEIPMEGEEEILDGLSPEDHEILFQAMSDYPELEGILNTISANDSSESFDTGIFDEEGSVEGPGTGTSDSIPANLSDGEFVFTAKAVSHLGVDKLRKMMAKAEIDYDEGDAKQQFAQMGDEGFAAGGLLTKPKYGSYAKGGEASGTKIRKKNTGPAGMTYSKSGINDVLFQLGVDESKMSRHIVRLGNGRFKLKNINLAHGGPVTDYAHDEGTSTGELTPGIGKETRDRGNPHIGEEAIMGRTRIEDLGFEDIDEEFKSEGDLGTRLMEELGLDDKGFKGFKKGMPQIGRARDEWQTG